MSRKLYPTDLTDQQWQLIKSLVPASQAGGHPRTVDMRYILNAIFYIKRQWLCFADVTSRLTTLVYSLLLFSMSASQKLVEADEPSFKGKAAKSCAAERTRGNSKSLVTS